MTEIPSGFEPQNPDAIAAMRLAHATPQPLSAEQEAEFNRFRSRALIRRIETIRVIRRGRLVFRVRGRRGNDLPCHPLHLEAQRALEKWQRQVDGDRRRPDPSLGVRARQTKAQARAQRVLDLYPLYAHRGRAAGALIAKKLDEKLHYVQRILRENVHDRNNRFR